MLESKSRVEVRLFLIYERDDEHARNGSSGCDARHIKWKKIIQS